MIRFSRCLMIFFSSCRIYSVGTPCFNYEVFCHVNPPGVPAIAAQLAIANYPNVMISANHNVAQPIKIFSALPIAPGINGWMAPVVIAPAPMTWPEIRLMILRRPNMNIRVDRGFLAAVAAVPVIGPIPPHLAVRARNGGYLNRMLNILMELTLRVLPPGVFAPGANAIMVHISLPTRVSKNMDELAHSSLIVLGIQTLKSRINAPFALMGRFLPDSATVVSSDHLR